MPVTAALANWMLMTFEKVVPNLRGKLVLMTEDVEDPWKGDEEMFRKCACHVQKLTTEVMEAICVNQA